MLRIYINEYRLKFDDSLTESKRIFLTDMYRMEFTEIDGKYFIIKGNKEELYNALIKISKNYDVELV